MMKKLFALLMILLCCAAAMAETADVMPPEERPADASTPGEALAPFYFELPEGVSAAASGTSVIFVHGNGTTRVVATVLDRVPDPEGDHEAELAKLMALFAPTAEAPVPLALTEGCWGLMAEIPGALQGVGETSITQVTAMVLWQSARQAELLILSGYDMAGDTARARTMVSALLDAAALDGVPLRLPVAK